MTNPIDRQEAVKAIAGHIADRDAFVVSVPPQLIQAVASRIDRLPKWTAFVDNGTDLVMTTSGFRMMAVIDLLVDTTAVLTVPKTVAASTLSEVVGQDVPADGSQDIVMLHTGAAPYIWPLLFLDALEVVDPGSPSQIRMNNLSNLN
jgi:hypothetical protein